MIWNMKMALPITPRITNRKTKYAAYFICQNEIIWRTTETQYWKSPNFKRYLCLRHQGMASHQFALLRLNFGWIQLPFIGTWSRLRCLSALYLDFCNFNIPVSYIPAPYTRSRHFRAFKIACANCVQIWTFSNRLELISPKKSEIINLLFQALACYRCISTGTLKDFSFLSTVGNQDY